MTNELPERTTTVFLHTDHHSLSLAIPSPLLSMRSPHPPSLPRSYNLAESCNRFPREYVCMSRLAACLQRLPVEVLAETAAAALQRCPDLLRRAEQALPVPEWAIERVLLSPDLLQCASSPALLARACLRRRRRLCHVGRGVGCQAQGGTVAPTGRGVRPQLRTDAQAHLYAQRRPQRP